MASPMPGGRSHSIIDARFFLVILPRFLDRATLRAAQLTGTQLFRASGWAPCKPVLSCSVPGGRVAHDLNPFIADFRGQSLIGSAFGLGTD